MKRPKRTFTQGERELIFDLWKQGSGFSDIGRVVDAKLGTIFTVLREVGGIQPEPKRRNSRHLTLRDREEIRVGTIGQNEYSRYCSYAGAPSIYYLQRNSS